MIDFCCHVEPKAKSVDAVPDDAHLGSELIIRKERFFAALRMTILSLDYLISTGSG